MKLSELRPCDNCGSPLGRFFYVVRCSLAMVSPQAGREVLGLWQYFGGRLDLAEALAPDADVVKVSDETVGSLSESFVCQACCLGVDLRLAVLMEKTHATTNEERGEEAAEAHGRS